MQGADPRDAIGFPRSIMNGTVPFRITSPRSFDGDPIASTRVPWNAPGSLRWMSVGWPWALSDDVGHALDAFPFRTVALGGGL